MNDNNVDLLIGTKIRLRRHVLGMSQTDLGNRIGVTFQQVQKYEKGHNKIVASRLLEVTNIMDVPISYFFEDLNNTLVYCIGLLTISMLLMKLQPNQSLNLL